MEYSKTIPLRTEPHDRVWIHNAPIVPEGIKDTILLYLDSTLQNSVFNNFENRIMEANGKEYKLIGTSQYRPYSKIWHLSHLPGYWDQTPETIVDWAEARYRSIMHPALYYLMKTVQKLEPFNGERDWVVNRAVFNHLAANTPMHGHIDFNEYELKEDAKIYSVSFYAKIPKAEGGEFWDETGFMHKPEENSALINVGSDLMHGVTTSTEDRLGVTMRFVRPTDLVLPGSVDKLIYKP